MILTDSVDYIFFLNFFVKFLAERIKFEGKHGIRIIL